MNRTSTSETVKKSGIAWDEFKRGRQGLTLACALHQLSEGGGSCHVCLTEEETKIQKS